jgi:hypothetical protein
MVTPAEKKKIPTVQEVCIDLPGETVQCWRSSDNIKVILRKHRDIIFHFDSCDGKIYTVEASESDFYNARDKKLVTVKNKGVVTFKDGERLHLWVAREFKGVLILKTDGKILNKIEPNDLDKNQYDNLPKTKPAPIIIRIGAQPKQIPLVANSVKKNISPVAMMPTPSAAPVDEDCPVVCVIDGDIHGMPKYLVEYFAKGGGKSGLADIDPNEIATRNWIFGQIAGTGAYLAGNWDWLRASLDGRTHQGFKLVKAKIAYVRGKVRFYFSGYSKYNVVFGSGGFGPGNERIMSIFSGVGKTSSSFAATAKAVAGSFRGFALVSFIFGSVTAIAEWKDDVEKDGYDLAAALFVALIKTIVVAIVVASIVAALVIIVMMTFSISVPIILVGAITVGAGVVVSYYVDVADKIIGGVVANDESNADGLAGAIAPWLRRAEDGLHDSWQYLIEKFPADYKGMTF